MPKHHSDFNKGQVIGLFKAKLSNLKINEITKIPISTIKRWKKKFNGNSKLKRKIRTRVKSKTNDRTGRLISRWLLTGQCKSAKEATILWNKNSKINLSYSSIKNVIHKNGLVCRSKIKKPSLNSMHKAQRLKFAKKMLKDNFDWKKVIFSDETKINLHGSDGINFTWMRKNDEILSNNNNIIQTKKFGGGGMMVWGCFGYKDVGFICSVKDKIDSQCYVEILEEYMAPSVPYCVDDEKDYIFQQDNASIHKSMKTKKYFQDNDITVLDFPPYSPDLNPIENLWGIVKRNLYKNGPYKSINKLSEAFSREWSNITPELCKKLIDSMEDRLKAVVKAKGGFTKY